jgi:hypothetical protein
LYSKSTIQDDDITILIFKKSTWWRYNARFQSWTSAKG